MIGPVGKLAVLAVTALICAGVVRRGTPEIALLLVLAAGVAVLGLVMGELQEVVEELWYLAWAASLQEELLRPVLKTVAISVVTKITGEICRCGGEGGLAACVETAGVVLALWVALPLVRGVLELMGELMV